MSDPGAVTFPLLELGLAGHRPGDEWFADAGKMHVIDCAWRRDDAGFDVPPRFPATGPQAFAANIAFVGFGGSCLGDRHEPDIQGECMGSRSEVRIREENAH